jgi:hypothetical protein
MGWGGVGRLPVEVDAWLVVKCVLLFRLQAAKRREMYNRKRSRLSFLLLRGAMWVVMLQ